LHQGAIVYGESALSFQDIVHTNFADGNSEIVGRGSCEFPRTDKVPLGSPVPFWEIGFGASEVEIDEMTGQIKILKYVSVTDAGKMIHPVQCHGQDEGSVLFGIGQTFLEDLIYEDGQLVNLNLVDYRLPKFSDLPMALDTTIREDGGG